MVLAVNNDLFVAEAMVDIKSTKLCRTKSSEESDITLVQPMIVPGVLVLILDNFVLASFSI